MPDDASHRRDFLKGKAFQDGIRRFGDGIADSIIGHTQTAAPEARDTLRLTQRAMACDFSVIMNAGEHESIWRASGGLDLVAELESQLSVYREDSEISRLNATAFNAPRQVEPRLFALLQIAQEIASQTDNAFDLTTDPLIRLWRECREAGRVPNQAEIDRRLSDVGMHFVQLDAIARTVALRRPGVSVNLGAIGKGYALDRVAEYLRCSTDETDRDGNRNLDYLLHGGQSSLLAHGQHTGCQGWPVGIGNPLFTDRRLGTIVLMNQAMATSGSNIQYYRVGDRRYGHILDPRTGWPVEGTLSVTAIADTAAKADALSTAFYVMGTDRIAEYCATHVDVGAIVIPIPSSDRRVQPLVLGVDPQQIYWNSDQIRTPPPSC